MYTTISKIRFGRLSIDIYKSEHKCINKYSIYKTESIQEIKKVSKLVTVVEDDQKAPFSIATRGRRYSFPWIAPLYP